MTEKPVSKKRKRSAKDEAGSKKSANRSKKRSKSKESKNTRVRGMERDAFNIDVEPFDVPSIIFKRIFELSKDIGEDVMLRFNRKGVYANILDITNSSIMWMRATSDMYSYDSSDEVAVCIEVSRLDKSIKGSDKDDMSIVKISKGEIFIDTDGIVVRSPVFIDCQGVPDVVHSIIDELPNRITVSIKPIIKFIDKAKGDEGHLVFRLKDGNLSISKLSYDSDSEDVRLDVKNIKDADIQGDCESFYSKELLFPVFIALSKISDNVNIYLGRDLPIYIGVDIHGYKVNYVVAPRIDQTD